jgi:hypothetical protein
MCYAINMLIHTHTWVYTKKCIEHVNVITQKYFGGEKWAPSIHSEPAN